MLTKFSVKNFKGFKEELVFDLTKTKKYEFNENLINKKNGIIKNGLIYGENGSGKSNLGLAIFDVVNHLTDKNKKLDSYTSYICGDSSDNFVSFEYNFLFLNDRISYRYRKNAEQKLCFEEFIFNDKQIFFRDEKEVMICDEFPVNNDLKQSLKIQSNISSIINFLLVSFPLDKNHYLIRVNAFINNMLWFRSLDERAYIGFTNIIESVEDYIISNSLVEDFQAFLKEVSGQLFKLSSISINSQQQVLLCNFGNKNVSFQQIASTGTKSLELLYYWYKQISVASFIFIDEFDAFYHYELAFNICKKLFGLNCQIFLSTHNTYLLTNDLSRPDCNFYLKNNKIESLAYRTDKELRNAHNVEKMYRAGSFSE